MEKDKEIKEDKIVDQKSLSVSSPSDITSSEFLNSPDKMYNLLQTYLIKSTVLRNRFKTPEEAMQAAMYGIELGFGFSVALNVVDVVEGKSTLNTHGMRAICLKHDLIFKTIEDYAVVKKKIKDKTGAVKVVPDMIPLSDGTGIPNRRTVIEFKRFKHIRTINKIITLVEKGEYTTRDILLTESKNQALVKHPKRMLYKLAFADGVHKIGSDLLQGALTKDEMHQFYNGDPDDIDIVDFEEIKDEEIEEKSSNTVVDDSENSDI